MSRGTEHNNISWQCQWHSYFLWSTAQFFFVIWKVLGKLLLFFHWHYSPLWALACRTMSFHFFLSATNSLHLLTPSTWRSLINMRMVNYIRTCVGAQLISRVQRTVTWSPAAWSHHRLCYRPAVFFHHRRLTEFSFTQRVGDSYRVSKILFFFPYVFKNFVNLKLINPLTPNDPYSGRTALLTSKHWILYIYSTNIGTKYFKHVIYSPFF